MDFSVIIPTRNRPQYVVLTEESYSELVEAQQEASLARIKQKLVEETAATANLEDDKAKSDLANKKSDKDAS